MSRPYGTILDMSDGSDSGSGSDSLSGEMSPTPVPEVQTSPAVQRFESCRWRQAAEDGDPAHCTHRDVEPMAGIHTFSADAWCADCQYYKIRRTPRKRPAQTAPDPYYY
jgi:hypothetical protein